MRSRIGTWLLSALTVVFVGSPVAAATPNVVTLVPAHAPCGAPNVTHPLPPASDACTPPEALSSYEFVRSKKNWIRLSTTASQLVIRVQLEGVTSFHSPASSLGFSARIVARITDGQCDGSQACTLVDTALSIPVHCNAARCSGNHRVDLARNRTGFEVVAIEVIDDEGKVLAVPGLVP